LRILNISDKEASLIKQKIPIAICGSKKEVAKAKLRLKEALESFDY
jgi:hypothetical protein